MYPASWIAPTKTAVATSPFTWTSLRGMSTSTRADLSTEVTALVIVLAQCPHVMSLTLKVTIASPVPVGIDT